MLRKMLVPVAALLLVGCSSSTTSPPPSSSGAPAAAKPQTLMGSTTAPPPDAPITYTVEPFDYDGTMGLTMTVTQDQFGGKMCPCMKIPYPADGSAANNQKGADAINAATAHMKAGDTLMGFSLGVQVISLFLAQHQLPEGVHVLLAGDTFARNAQLVAAGQGIPANISNDVTMVVNEYDGWSDSPDLTGDPGYATATIVAAAGTQRLHYYANADVNNPANVVVQVGNIKTVLIPTRNMPQNDYLRGMGMDASIDSIEAQQRPKANTAWSRPGSTKAQRDAAGAEQVPQPNPAWDQKAEPVVGP